MSKRDIVIPDDIFNLFLKPLAKKLKIRYIPRNSSLLIRSIFKKISERAEFVDSGRLKEILKSTEQLVGPAETVVKIIGTFARPLFALIPPQYLAMIFAIVFGVTIIVPSQIIGLTALHFAEDFVRVPFMRSKREYERVPKALRKSQLEVTRITKKTLTMPGHKWFTLEGRAKLDYWYEAPAELKAILTTFELVLEFMPQLSLKDFGTMSDDELDYIEEILAKLPVPVTIDFQAPISITRHTYYGNRKILPPIMHMVVGFFHRILDALGLDDPSALEKILEEWQKHPKRTFFKYFFLGIWGLRF